ncbi:hypothetical protein GT755_29130 [Herbidospora sp. NEAU-GS84]|uniref:Uncharacterized protein n=1 Tax=Herbidospora solisilvae TaxID=2696284 RepID=A0A7C9NLN6_9ACTN|nr:hypothetical protein [Herbidospora solisilvae]NAS25732.1 hypothetical protein [Herbidospora solisilvae]
MRTAYVQQAGQDSCVRGVVRDFQPRRERSMTSGDMEMESWHFRIERHDASGNRLAPVPVEMKGLTFVGALSNGDEVSVRGVWRDGTLRVQELTNLTTNAYVRAKDYRVARTAVMIAVLVGFVVVVTIILSVAVSMCSAPWPPEMP